eukprot:COSAG04_NODE_539_length_12879_cov_5.371205_15_plen_251_part_00
MLNDNDEDLFPELVAPPEKVVEYEPPEDISQHIPEDPIEEQEEEIIQHPEPKEILKKNDIFISKPSSKKKIKVENNDEAEEGEPLDIVPVKKPRKKRVMTEEHKAKLALARQKGMETRKRNAELRRQAKEQKLKEKEDSREEKEIIKAVRRKRIAKLKKELDSDEEKEKPKQIEKQEPQTKVVEKIIERGYTQDDMTAAISAALEKQEQTRKARKVIKKKELEEKQHQERVFKTVSRAVDPNDVWANCFN